MAALIAHSHCRTFKVWLALAAPARCGSRSPHAQPITTTQLLARHRRAACGTRVCPCSELRCVPADPGPATAQQTSQSPQQLQKSNAGRGDNVGSLCAPALHQLEPTASRTHCCREQARDPRCCAQPAAAVRKDTPNSNESGQGITLAVASVAEALQELHNRHRHTHTHTSTHPNPLYVPVVPHACGSKPRHAAGNQMPTDRNGTGAAHTRHTPGLFMSHTARACSGPGPGQRHTWCAVLC